MWKLLSLIIICSCTCILGSDIICGRAMECRRQEECPAFLQEKSKLELLKRNSDEYKQILSEIKSLVCNKLLKKVCCDKELLENITPDPRIRGDDLICREERECLVVTDCPLFELDKNQLNFIEKGSEEYKEKLEEIKGLVCNKRRRKVCCLKTFIDPPQPNITPNSPTWVPNLEKQECGVSAEGSQFVVGGNNTKLGEFPWLVLLGKRSEQFGGQIY